MSKIKHSFFTIRYLLTSIFYLVAVVTLVHLVNFGGVLVYGLDFLNWWPLGQSKLFGIGGLPNSTLSTETSGLAVEFAVPGLDLHLKKYWLSGAGLSLVTHGIFLAILATFRRMLVTVDIHQPFNADNIRRVQFIIGLILIEIFVLDFLRTESMQPVKTLINQMSGPMIGTDSSYQNAGAHAYILLLLLITLVAIFRRGLVMYKQQNDMQKQLYQKRKMEAVGTLASGIAHDFNNILTSIIGYAELAKTEQTPQERQFALDRVLESSNRAKRLTLQIRAIGGQHHVTEQEEWFDLKDEVNEFLLSISPTISENIEVVKLFNLQESYKIYADPTKIYQVLLNLCTNSLQAIGSNQGQISIAINKENHQKQSGICLTIQDTGCGINKEQQQQIFEPYFTTKKQKGGTGLGLALSYSIVESYGGFISFTSEEGKGSCFKVWLPDASVENNETAKFTALTDSKRILVVDDDKTVLELVKRKLSGIGYQVDAFNNGIEALKTFQQSPNNYDGVIVDLDMPEITGIELTKKIKDITMNIPAIMITADPEKAILAANSVSINKVISKPIAFSELHEALLKLFENSTSIGKN